ncbi:MAG: YncE family protein [Planctomycetota bacterium]
MTRLALLLFLLTPVTAQTALWTVNTSAGSVSRVDPQTRSVTATIPSGNSPVDLAFHPDGNTLFVANFRSANVAVIDSARSTRTASISVGDYPAGVGVTPDGRSLLVVRDYSGLLLVIDTATHVVRTTIPIVRSFSGGVGSVVFTPDDRYAFVISGAVTVLDLSTMSIVTSYGAGFSIASAAITPDGSQVWFVDGWTGVINGFDTRTHASVGAIQVGSLPREVAIGVDGRTAFVTIPAYLAMVNGVGAPAPLRSLRVLDLENRNIVRSITTTHPPIGVTRSLDGRSFFVTLQSGGQMAEFDATSLALVAQYPVGPSPATVIAQPAVATSRNFGSPCVGPLGAVTTVASTQPWLGTDWILQFERVDPAAMILGAVGFAPQSVPFAALVPGGLPGCDLLVDPSFMLPVNRLGAVDRLTIPLPAIRDLIAARAVVQAIVIGAGSVYGSDALEGTFGMR